MARQRTKRPVKVLDIMLNIEGHDAVVRAHLDDGQWYEVIRKRIMNGGTSCVTADGIASAQRRGQIVEALDLISHPTTRTETPLPFDPDDYPLA